MSDSRHILFLTTTNLAANPRLTKELRLASSNGFACTVIQFRLGNWSDKITDQLKEEFDFVTFIELSALRKPFIPWFLGTLLQQICNRLPLFLVSPKMLSLAVGKRSFLLLRKLEKVTGKFDWVIAHNPASFYPAYSFATKNKVKLGFDIEDYHPGESTVLREQFRMKLLMKQTLPAAAYCSYAAPLIAKKVREDIPTLNNDQIVLINGFNSTDFFPPQSSKKPLQIVWFSQYIDKGRGLEAILSVIDDFFPMLEFHIFGNLNVTFGNEYLYNKKAVVIHRPLPQKELHAFLSNCDVGLALEPGRDTNNQIAISNKMIAYAQAGLFIVSSNTLAQEDFLKKSDLEYLLTDLSENSIRLALSKILDEKENIRTKQQDRYIKGSSYAWEIISKDLLTNWKKENY